MNKQKLIKRLRRLKAAWCSMDEFIVSILSFKNEPLLKWGIDNNLLTEKKNNDRIEIYFKSESFLKHLRETTCAFSGKTVR